MTAAADHMTQPKTSSRFLRRALPYLLSLPALLVCIGIQFLLTGISDFFALRVA